MTSAPTSAASPASSTPATKKETFARSEGGRKAALIRFFVVRVNPSSLLLTDLSSLNAAAVTGDRMRTRSIFLVFSALLAMPYGAPAQQGAAPNDKKTETTERKLDKRTEITIDGKTYKAPPPENWASFSDLKTGLQTTEGVPIQRDEHPDFVRELVRVQWRLGDPIDLWISRPKVAGKTPVVLYLYSYTDTNDRFRDDGWAKRATADGFAAVGFVPALAPERYTNRPMKQWFVSELRESLGSTVHDVQLILNYLADRGDMDTDNVGMFGMGAGGTIAILAASVDSRIKAIDVLDPWGDWPDWLKNSPVVPDAERPKYLTPEFLQSVAAFDPVVQLPRLESQSVRLQQTMSEGFTPNAAKTKIADVVPHRATLVRYNNSQELLTAWKSTGLSGWIKQQMRPQPSTGSRAEAASAPPQNRNR
jgi:X-Pro dipeptidyl-peptidase (S15 family)